MGSYRLIIAMLALLPALAFAADDLDDWLNSEPDTGLFPDLHTGEYGDYESGSITTSPDVTQPVYDTNPPDRAPGVFDNLSNSQLVTELNNGWSLVNAPDGSATSNCAAVLTCTGASHLAYVKNDKGEIKTIPISNTERGALLAIRSTVDTTVGSDMQAWIANSSSRDRALAGILAQNMAPNEETGQLIKDRLNASFNLNGISSSGSGATAQDVNYLGALQSGDSADALLRRQQLLDATKQELIGLGIAPADAERYASDYVNDMFDRPMLSGNDAQGLIGSINAERLAYGLPAILPNDLSARELLAMDMAREQNPGWRFSGSPEDMDFLESYLILVDQQYNDLSRGTTTADTVSDAEASNSLGTPESPSTLTGIGSGYPSAGSDVSGGSTIDNTGGTILPGLTGGISPGGGKLDLSAGPHAWIADALLPDTDMIYISLRRLFGSPIETIYSSLWDPTSGKLRPKQTSLSSANSGSPTAITFIVTSMLFFVLIFTCLIISYMVIYGLYRSAQDGQIMGKDWNAFWTPARGVIGAVMVMPIPAVSGLTGAQVFIIVCILMGTMIASTIAYFAFTMMMTQPIIQPVIKKDESFIPAVAKAHACLALRKEQEMYKDDFDLSSQPYQLYFDGSGKTNGDTEPPINSTTWDKVLSFFSSGGSGSSDPLKETGDKLYEAIGSIYKTTKINPYSHGVRRLKFGPYGECGVIYLPEPIRTIGSYEPNDTVITMALGTTKHSRSNAPSRVAFKERQEAQNEAEGLNAFNRALEEGSYTDLRDKMQAAQNAWKNTIATNRYNAITSAFNTANTKIYNAVRSYRLKYSVEETGEPNENEPQKPPEYRLGDFAASLTRINRDFYEELGTEMTKAMREIEDPSVAFAAATVRSLGWMSLGTMYWSIENRQALIMSMYNFENMATLDSVSVSVDSTKGDIDELQAEIKKINSIIDRSIGPTGVQYAAQLMQTTVNGITPDEMSAGQFFSDAVTGLLLEGSYFADIENFNISPIERVRHLGVTINNAVIGGKILIAGSKAVMTGFGKSLPAIAGGGFFAGLAAFLGEFAEIFAGLVDPILSGAFICANIIPAMPYVMLMAAAVGYLIYCVEAVVGVNFWMMMTGHPDGHDVWGKGGTGFPIILTLILRPSLIVLGFCVGIGFNWVFGHWINATIQPAMQLQNAGAGGFGLGNLSQFAGVLVIFSGLHLFSCYKSFSLSWELPNAILRWMSVQDHQDLGEREAKDNALAVAVPAGRGVGGALRSRQKPEKADKGSGGDSGGDNQSNENPATGGGAATGGDQAEANG